MMTALVRQDPQRRKLEIAPTPSVHSRRGLQLVAEYLKGILCDRRSIALFHAAAISAIPTTVTFAATITPVFDGLDGVAFRAAMAIFGVVFVLSSMVILYGMLAYLLGVDQESWKLGWLFLFLFTGSVGAAIYCFAVYRKQQKQRPGVSLVE